MSIGLAGHGGEDGEAEGFGPGEGTMGEELETDAAGSLFFAGYFDKGDIHAVGGGSAHNAGDDERFILAHAWSLRLKLRSG